MRSLEFSYIRVAFSITTIQYFPSFISEVSNNLQIVSYIIYKKFRTILISDKKASKLKLPESFMCPKH